MVIAIEILEGLMSFLARVFECLYVWPKYDQAIQGLKDEAIDLCFKDKPRQLNLFNSSD